ncbi:MAG: YceH family protein [Marinicellaceae bacterium]
MNEENQQKPFFTSLEARVIACLMEKQLTTPNNYPLTLNSLMLACNQKSNREPVMQLTEGQVGHTVNTLKDRDLLEIDYSGRANHISHRVTGTLNLNKKKQAILTVLMVRNPLTLNDIKARTNRMVEFEDLNEINDYLEKMIAAEIPLASRINKTVGSREDRYTHMLCGEVSNTQENNKKPDRIGQRINITKQNKLEDRLSALEKKVEKLMELLD